MLEPDPSITLVREWSIRERPGMGRVALEIDPLHQLTTCPLEKPLSNAATVAAELFPKTQI